MKDQKGITLIALVITIIVLLILAGVAIAMLSGDNGILSKASESSVKTALGAAKDEAYNLATEALTNYYENVYVDTPAGQSKYEDIALDKKVWEALSGENDQKLANGQVSISWTNGGSDLTNGESITDENNLKIKLTYIKDGSYVEGKLAKGAITWEDVVMARDNKE